MKSSSRTRDGVKLRAIERRARTQKTMAMMGAEVADGGSY